MPGKKNNCGIGDLFEIIANVTATAGGMAASNKVNKFAPMACRKSVNEEPKIPIASEKESVYQNQNQPPNSPFVRPPRSGNCKHRKNSQQSIKPTERSGRQLAQHDIVTF